jgi:amino acid transporter
VYAYSRDGALPFSHWLKQVNRWTQTPVYAVWFIAFIGALQCLLVFGGPVAINAIFSVVAIAQYAAYITPISLKLFFGSEKFKPG